MVAVCSYRFVMKHMSLFSTRLPLCVAWQRRILHRLVCICTMCLLTTHAALLHAGPWENPGHNWKPQPDNAAVMAISSHPDDEGIFFGGTLPYYTQVLQLPTVHVSLNDGDWSGASHAEDRRHDELRNADWVYGLPNEPIVNDDFPGEPTQAGQAGYASAVDVTWDWWNDQQLDGFGSPGQDAAAGKQRTIEYLATQIRTYKPDVIFAHDIDGEYGHANHRATGIAAAEAFHVAADPVFVDGNAPYQAKKIYLHQSQANGLGSVGYEFENWLFHDFMEQTSIDTNGDSTADKSPRQVADDGLDEHITQGRPDVSTVYRTGENFDGHHSEWWGLLASTVGSDTLATPFEIEGETYTDWARGDFLENIDLSPYFNLPSILGDINLDGIVSGDGSGFREQDDITAFIDGWGTTGHLSIKDKWIHGDLTLDGRTDIFDWHLLRSNHMDRADLNLQSLLERQSVPEPSSILLVCVVATLLILSGSRL